MSRNDTGSNSNVGKVWSFQEQLSFGDRAEELFFTYYPRKLDVIVDNYADFRVRKTGQLLELKTDTYNMNKTDNFFIERWSDIHKDKPGSVWQSAPKGVEIFCYYFVRHNTWFEFRNVPSLISRLDAMIESGEAGRMIHIRNRGWITGGYKVSRASLSDLYDIYEFTPTSYDKRKYKDILYKVES
jgi:hypothetical protein